MPIPMEYYALLKNIMAIWSFKVNKCLENPENQF